MIESVREINKKYNGEWIMLANTISDVHGNLTEGEVVIHSRDKDAVFDYVNQNKSLKPSVTIRYGGYISEGFVVEI